MNLCSCSLSAPWGSLEAAVCHPNGGQRSTESKALLIKSHRDTCGVTESFSAEKPNTRSFYLWYLKRKQRSEAAWTDIFDHHVIKHITLEMESAFITKLHLKKEKELGNSFFFFFSWRYVPLKSFASVSAHWQKKKEERFPPYLPPFREMSFQRNTPQLKTCYQQKQAGSQERKFQSSLQIKQPIKLPCNPTWRYLLVYGLLEVPSFTAMTALKS